MLITTIDKFIEIIPTIDSKVEYADLKPFIKIAEAWLKTNITGSTLYTAIDEGSQSTSAGKDEDLLFLCQNIICNHAYWVGIPLLDLQQTKSGFGVVQSNNLVPASKERVKNLRDQCLVNRDNGVEDLITYLESKTIYHTAWKGSPAYSIISDCLIQTATELSIYAEWEGTRKDFLKLRPALIRETAVRLDPVFSKDYIDELVEKQRDDDLSGDDAKVIVLLKQSLGCLVTGNVEAAEKVAYDALRYIDSNPESFETYLASEEYAARIATGFVNETTNTIFSSIF